MKKINHGSEKEYQLLWILLGKAQQKCQSMQMLPGRHCWSQCLTYETINGVDTALLWYDDSIGSTSLVRFDITNF